MHPALVNCSASEDGSSSSDDRCGKSSLISARREVEDGSGIGAVMETGSACENGYLSASEALPVRW